PIPYADNDRVALVTLHTLQVFHEKTCITIRVEEFMQFWVFFQLAVNSCLHPVHVPNTHGDHTQRLRGALASMVQDHFDYFANLRTRTFFLSVNAGFLLHQHMIDYRWAARPRKGHQSVLIKVVIREVDE